MKIKLIIVSILTFLCLTSPAQALNSDASNSARQNRQEKREERREEIKAKLTEQTKNRINKSYSVIKERLNKRIERIAKLADRVEALFPKWQEKGRDTTVAYENLTKARGYLSVAEQDIVNTDTILNNLLNANNPRDYKEELHNSIKKVREDLVNAHQAISTAVNDLKRQEGETNEN